MNSRRRFLVNCSTVAIAATLAPGIVLAGRMPPQLVSLDRLSFATFVQALHTSFEVYTDFTDAVELELIEAKPWRSSHRMALSAQDARNEKFSLLFRGPGDRPLPQSMHLFDHEAIGSFVMFIVPILSGDPALCYYEAVFNRPIGRAKRIGIGPIHSGQEMMVRPPAEQ